MCQSHGSFSPAMSIKLLIPSLLWVFSLRSSILARLFHLIIYTVSIIALCRAGESLQVGVAPGTQSLGVNATAAAFQSAFALHVAGRVTEAASLYQNIIEADPSHAEAHHFLAQIVGGAGDLDAGVRLASVAATLAGSDPNVWNTLGEMHRKRG